MVDGQYINSLCAHWQQQFRRDPDCTFIQNMSAWLSYRESQRKVARYERELRMEAERVEREERLEEEERAYQQRLAQERVAMEERLSVENTEKVGRIIALAIERVVQQDLLTDSHMPSDENGSTGSEDTDIEE